MFKLLDRLFETAATRHDRHWRDGYDWAAGKLLRGDATPQEINARTFGSENPFDRGAQAALTKLILKDVVQTPWA